MYLFWIAKKNTPPVLLAAQTDWRKLLYLGKRVEIEGEIYYHGSDFMPPLIVPKGYLGWVEKLGQSAKAISPSQPPLFT